MCHSFHFISFHSLTVHCVCVCVAMYARVLCNDLSQRLKLATADSAVAELTKAADRDNATRAAEALEFKKQMGAINETLRAANDRDNAANARELSLGRQLDELKAQLLAKTYAHFFLFFSFHSFTHSHYHSFIHMTAGRTHARIVSHTVRLTVCERVSARA
jgi:hypothetical protein